MLGARVCDCSLKLGALSLTKVTRAQRPRHTWQRRDSPEDRRRKTFRRQVAVHNVWEALCIAIRQLVQGVVVLLVDSQSGEMLGERHVELARS